MKTKKTVATYSIDKKLLIKFRKKAIEEGESMSSVLVNAIKKYVGK